MRPVTVQVEAKAKRRFVRTQHAQELVDPATGEVKAIAMIHTVDERDDASFVKVFAAGVREAFALSASGAKVFQAVLSVYEQEKMTGGYADSLTLFWFGEGLNGASINVSEKTFQRGLKELLAKEFIMPKAPNQYWVNPALFFKGDRVAFVKEYRRRAPPKEAVVIEQHPLRSRSAQMDIEGLTGQPVHLRGELQPQGGIRKRKGKPCAATTGEH